MTRVRTSAFSLVEVTIALGITAFALAAIVGLLSLTLKNSKSAQDDTLVAEMAGDLINGIRKQEFAAIPMVPTVYFDIGGKRLNSSAASGEIQSLSPSTAISEGGIYECVPSIQVDQTTANPDGSANLYRISLNFKWPIGTSGSVNEKTIQADIARY